MRMSTIGCNENTENVMLMFSVFFFCFNRTEEEKREWIQVNTKTYDSGWKSPRSQHLLFLKWSFRGFCIDDAVWGSWVVQCGKDVCGESCAPARVPLTHHALNGFPFPAVLKCSERREWKVRDYLVYSWRLTCKKH